MRSRRDLLISPLFVTTLIALVINDHVLKGAWPGLVSGKLSDVAGVAMVALLATAITGRRSIGVTCTGIAFVALKAVPGVAQLVAPIFGGVTRTDATDLVALAVLPAVWVWMGRAPSGRRPGSGAWLVPLQLVALGAAVLATTASSCEGEGVLGVAASDGVVYAVTVTDVYESADGGATWSRSDVEPFDPRLRRPYPDALVACTGPADCVEIVEQPYGPRPSTVDLTVDEVRGADRQTILTVSALQRQRLLTTVRSACGDGFFASISAVAREDGDHAVVAMGAAGVLHHRPDRSWEWVAVGEHGLRSSQVVEEPFGFPARSTVPADGFDSWPFGLVVALLAVAPLAVLLAIVPIARLARTHRRDPAVGIITCVVIGCGLAAVGLFVVAFLGGFRSRGDAAVGSVLVAAAAVCTVAPLLAWYARPRRAAGWDPPNRSERLG